MLRLNTYVLRFILSGVLVHFEESFHLEFVIEPRYLGVFLHDRHLGVDLLLAATPVDLERKTKVLRVGCEKKADVQFDLVLVGHQGSCCPCRYLTVN